MNADATEEVVSNSSYKETGIVSLRGLIPLETCDLARTYLTILSRTGGLTDDRQVVGSMSLYGDPLFDSILARLRPDIERACGIDLKPTYSFVRVYREGTQLVPHRDRPACEHSVTIHLASAGNGREWQIEFEDLNGDERSLVLDRGDAVVYQGCALRHWRRPCPSTWYAQGFFHYVAATGPHAAEMFDRRRYLGLSKGQEP